MRSLYRVEAGGNKALRPMADLRSMAFLRDLVA
jgi:hypothetical protein